MRRIRVGNDIWVRFAVMLGGELVELPPIEEVSVAVENISRWSETLQLHELAATDGVVSFHIRGADTIDELNANKYLGKYRITISYEQLGALHTLDAVAFELVQLSHLQGSTPHNCPELAVETVELTGDVATGKDGVTPHIGDNGNWWLGEEDTGMPSRGRQGDAGKPAYQSALDGGLPEHITEEDFNQYLAMNSEIIGEALDEINGEGYNDNVAKKITRLDTTKHGIAGAIVAKGVPVAETDTFASYANKIESIDRGLQEFYQQCGFGYATTPDGALMEMARISYEETKSWTDYSKARGNKKIRFVPNLKTTATDLYAAFNSCSALVTFTSDLTNATNLKVAFYGCTALTTFTSDLPRATDLNAAFSGCSALVTFASYLPLATNLTSAFSSCTALTTFASDLPRATDLSGAFYNCSSLTTFASDLPLATNLSNAFYNCSSLTHLTGFNGLKTNVDFSASTKLTVESMMNVIRNAADMTGKPAPVLTLGGLNLAKLTAEQKAIATNKNWTLS